MTVYVLGHASYGGCWIWRESYYTDEAAAYAECDRLRAKGDKTVKVFHLYLTK